MSTSQPTEFIAHPMSVEDIQHNNALAGTMSATCPLCAGESKVLAMHLQATRQKPCEFLCVQGWCVPCQMAFPVEHAQMALV